MVWLHLASSTLPYRILIVVAAVCAWTSPALPAQASQTTLHRLYVSTFDGKSEGEAIRKALMDQIRKLRNFALVDSPEHADATLEGESEIYVSGYVNLYVRAGTSPSNGTPLYKGYLSVELKSRSGETLWSYLSTLHSPTKSPANEVAKDVTKHLQNSFSGSSK
jgi:hypothetical protein